MLRDLLLDARSGFASGERADDGIAQIRMNNITRDGSWDWSRVVYVPRGSIDVQRYLLKPGDVLFNNTNSQELVGKTAQFIGYPVPITFSNHFTRLRPGPDLDSGYLALWLHRLWQSGFFVRASTRWVGQAAYGNAQLLSLNVPVPELGLQRRISSKLALELAAAENLQQRSHERLAQARVLRDNILDAAFDGRETTHQELLGRVGSLQDGDWILTADYEPTGVRLFQVGDVGRGSLLEKSNRYISRPRADELKCTRLQAGDILISRMPDPIGRACVVPDLGYESITAVDVTIFRPNPVILDTEYAIQFMNSRSWLRAVAAKASGATRARISRLNLELLDIPLPNLETQRRIAAELREQLAAIDTMEASIRAEQEASRALPAALLRRVFENLAA